MSSYDKDRRRSLAKGLKSARQRLGMNSIEAALEITRRGVSCQRGTLLAWERGVGTTSREPFASDLPVIAAVYGCLVGDLFAPLPIAPAPLNVAAINSLPLETAPTTMRAFAGDGDRHFG